MEIRVRIESLSTQVEEQVLQLPVAIGREISQLPEVIDGLPASPLVLSQGNNQISRYHALIKEDNGQVILEDKSSNGTVVNGKKITKQREVISGQVFIEIGNYRIEAELEPEATVLLPLNSEEEGNVATPNFEPSGIRSSTIIFNPETDLLEVNVVNSPDPEESRISFPPSQIFSQQYVSMSALRSTGLPIEETEYVSLGGGMGSFVWVDTLRISGVAAEDIAVIGLQPLPYGRYDRLLQNCQIYRYKRIRSGSDSCPDNIWGWPGYALREAWRDTFAGKINLALGYLWQVFAEPVFADTYTPKAGNVFASMDREGRRISWDKMHRQGSIRSIRKTEDGRYCIAYSANKPGHQDHRFLIAKYVHLCTGYPALKLLPDLQNYREKTGDLHSVVQGYEEHNHIYEKLEKRGGTVIIRGSGIVASQIMDRLSMALKVNSQIQVIHMNREPRKGNSFGAARRYVENDWEFQPFNWPKGTWGGDMRKMLENADPFKRRELLQIWGGTTTASRKPWRELVKQGLKEGWYQIQYGSVQKVEPNSQGGILTTLATNKGVNTIPADFIIDCTGLISNPQENPLLNDLITHYDLPLNPQDRLNVENDFEIKQMRNQQGKMYASGIITLGGPYAPVDTFLGLQYSAHRIVESLAQVKAPKVKYINGFYSLIQWVKWALNQRP